MKTLAILAISVLALVSGGCALLDSFAGVGPDGQPTGGGGGAIIGPIADRVIPGSGALIGGLCGIWAAIRGRKWKAAALSTFDVIEAGSQTGKSVKDLKGDLAAAHEKAGVVGIVEAAVEKYGHAASPTPTP